MAEEEKDESRFKVDDEWKESVAREKAEAAREKYQEAEGPQKAEELPEADFRVFLAGLYTQALMSLGEVENPASGRKERHLPETEYLVDTLEMLRDKTEGNRSQPETEYLTNLLHDLHMRYVRAAEESKGKQQQNPEESEDSEPKQ